MSPTYPAADLPQSDDAALRVIFLTLGRDSASTRYRVMQYLPGLEAHGIVASVEELPEGRAKRQLFSECQEYDLTVLQKRLLTGGDARALRRYARTLLYDFDDAQMFADAKRVGFCDATEKELRSWTRRRRFEAIARRADGLIAGNECLRCMASGLNENIVVLPTPIDTRRFPSPGARAQTTTEAETGATTLVWIGGRGTLGYLANLRPVLSALGERYPNVTLKIIATDMDRRFPEDELGGVHIQKCEWSFDSEVEELQRADVGLAPLTNDPWSRGKCAYKILQYFAAGLPVVCSPVGCQSSLVTDGHTGFTAAAQSDWVAKLSRVIEEPELRTKLGSNGRKLVEESYSLDALTPAFAEVLKKAGERRT